MRPKQLSIETYSFFRTGCNRFFNFPVTCFSVTLFSSTPTLEKVHFPVAVFGTNHYLNRVEVDIMRTIFFCVRRPFILSLFTLLLALGLRAQETAKTFPVRTWTSVNGNTVDGAFVREENGKIFIKRPDGSTISTSREKLSPLDLTWIDTTTNAKPAAKTLSFTKATLLETTKMEQYKLVRRVIINTYAQLTNNDRNDKMLAFLERDAQPMFGWKFISSECYSTPSGKKGKLKTIKFLAQAPVPLREAVQMARDKFSIAMTDPVTIKEISEEGDTYWELQNPPPYLARVLLLVDPETKDKDIKRFDLSFPPPEKP